MEYRHPEIANVAKQLKARLKQTQDKKAVLLLQVILGNYFLDSP